MIEKKKSFEEKADSHLRILQEMHDTYRAKNKDYGGSFEDLFKMFGMVSPFIKLFDKLKRIQSLMTKDPEVVGESIEDSLLDLANYAVMTVMELRESSSDRNNIDLFAFNYDSLPKVVAVDFDGTLVQGAEFPEIGELNMKLVEQLWHGKYKDYKKILWTHRSGSTLDAALKFIEEIPNTYGINYVKFDAVNDNIKEVKELLNGGPIKKVWFDVFIEDKSIRPEDIVCPSEEYLQREGVSA